MSLYLCVFEEPERDIELDGVEVGGYDDFHLFRASVAEELEQGRWGSRFPALMLHSDSDGTWEPGEVHVLEAELATIKREFESLGPVDFPDGWQAGLARALGLKPRSRAECYVDVDGEPLLDRLIALARLAHEGSSAIWFQ